MAYNRANHGAQRKEYLPSQTLYIKNLPDKLKKEELIRMLYLYFSQFGSILDVVAMRSEGMRGQAFVVFSDMVTAANAMREAQNNQFFNKQLVIQYAQKKSNAVALLDGTYLSSEKKQQQKQQEENREAEAELSELKRKAAESAQNSNKKVKPTTTIAVPMNIPPNKVLFVQNLPEDCSDLMLQPLFQAYPGFREVRLVPGGKGMAFVEFANELDSGRAMVELQGFRITLENPIGISFQQSKDNV
jgi:U2 small nuclear ribonucleoprotein B''